MKRSEGFTLIELLVVIAIIAILNAIILPMIPTANDRSNIAVCESNLRQIGLAMRMYMEDYGAMPADLNGLYTARYIDDPAVLVCSKTGNRYRYQKASLDADRSTVIASCVPLPQTLRGKRPHSFNTGVLTLTLGGTVRLQTH